MATEIRKWLHRQPSKRDWKKIFKRGEFLPYIAMERYPKLKRLVRDADYHPHMDGFIRKI